MYEYPVEDIRTCVLTIIFHIKPQTENRWYISGSRLINQKGKSVVPWKGYRLEIYDKHQ